MTSPQKQYGNAEREMCRGCRHERVSLRTEFLVFDAQLSFEFAPQIKFFLKRYCGALGQNQPVSMGQQKARCNMFTPSLASLLFRSFRREP